MLVPTLTEALSGTIGYPVGLTGAAGPAHVSSSRVTTAGICNSGSCRGRADGQGLANMIGDSRIFFHFENICWKYIHIYMKLIVRDHNLYLCTTYRDQNINRLVFYSLCVFYCPCKLSSVEDGQRLKYQVTVLWTIFQDTAGVEDNRLIS